MPASRERVREAFTSLGGDRRKVFAIVQFYGARAPDRGYTSAMAYSEGGGSDYAHKHAEAKLEERWASILSGWDDLEFHAAADTITRVDVTVKYSPCSYCALKLATLWQLTNQKAGGQVPFNVYYLEVYNGDPGGIQACTGFGMTCSKYEDTTAGAWWRAEGNGYAHLM